MIGLDTLFLQMVLGTDRVSYDGAPFGKDTAMDNGSLGLQFLGLVCMTVGCGMFAWSVGELWRIVHRRVGGLHFVRLARVQISFCVVRRQRHA